MSERTCSKPGCDRRHKARGLCNKHYRELQRRDYLPHPPHKEPVTPRDYILQRIHVTPDGCWRWTLALHPRSGYGMAYHLGAHASVHRFAYEAFVGPIPDGLVIDHLCRNRACVNPSHLEPVTAAENLRRGESLAARVVRSGYCAAGHRRSGDNLYVSPKGERHCRPCMVANRRKRYLAAKMARQSIAA